MGMLADRRDELGRARTQTVNRLHRLLLQLIPGGAKRFLSAARARATISRGFINDRHSTRSVGSNANEFKRCALWEKWPAGTEPNRADV